MSTEAAYDQRIEIPSEADVTVDGKTIKVTGELGSLERTFPEPLVDISIEGNDLVATTPISRKKTRALVGTVIAHTRNMIIGVTKGYTYEMKIVYSHFPISVERAGDEVLINNFIGERGPRRARIIGDVEIETTDDDVIISGIDIEAVSQTAANIQQSLKIRDKDRRIFLDGIYVIRKRKGDEIESIV
ncbi:MAG: 50S ribosomal protein L6 [Promethearchaeia archaeon]